MDSSTPFVSLSAQNDKAEVGGNLSLLLFGKQ